MNDTERERIKANVDAVKSAGPDAVEFVKKFHDAGLIEGWRDVRGVKPVEENKNEDV